MVEWKERSGVLERGLRVAVPQETSRVNGIAVVVVVFVESLKVDLSIVCVVVVAIPIVVVVVVWHVEAVGVVHDKGARV